MRYLFAITTLVLMVSGASVGHATEPTYADIAQAIQKQGYVSPGRFDAPKYHGQQKQALEWMRGLTTDQIQQLAKSVEQPGGKKNKGKWFGPGTGYGTALSGFESLLKQRISFQQAGTLVKENFSMRGDMRRYNQDVINLVAAYVNLIETGKIKPQVAVVADINNNNNEPSRVAQPQRTIGQEQKDVGDVVNLFAEALAKAFAPQPPEQIRRSPPQAQGFQEALAPDYGVMGFRPIRQANGTVIYQIPGGDELFRYDWGINDYVML